MMSMEQKMCEQEKMEILFLENIAERKTDSHYAHDIWMSAV